MLAAGREGGFLLRDLRLFQDGHYYLPALSLPFVGGADRARARRDAEAFWGHHFAEPVGRVKARLLARYGLWFETPNPQNLLVQLDRNLFPTGKARVPRRRRRRLRHRRARVRDVPWRRLSLRSAPRDAHLVLGVRRGGRALDPADVLERWYARHDTAYYAELARWFPEIAPPPGIQPRRTLGHWNQALRSDAGPGSGGARVRRARGSASTSRV